MPFKEEFDQIYNIYVEICQSKKIEAKRINSYGKADIIQQIFENLKETDIIIVDISTYNPNVFYELGYYHGYHKFTNNIILTLKETIQDHEIPFDIHGLETLSYNDIETFKKKINLKLEYLINPQNEPYSCVKWFYKCISTDNYNDAWKALSNDFKRRRFNKSIKLFKSGYKSHSILKLNIDEYISGDKIVKYYVSYISESQVPDIKQFPDIRNKTIKDLPEICNEIKIIQREITEKGLDYEALDDMTLREVTSKNCNDIFIFYLRRKCQSKLLKKKISSFYDGTKLVSLHNGYIVTVCKKKKQWYISSIMPI